MTDTTFEVGDKVRRAGWRKKHYVTLLRPVTTKSGKTGWWGWHSEGYHMALEDGSFDPRRGKKKTKEKTKG